MVGAWRCLFIYSCYHVIQMYLNQQINCLFGLFVVQYNYVDVRSADIESPTRTRVDHEDMMGKILR